MAQAQAKQALKDGYELAGFEVVDETPTGETLLRYPHYQTNDILLRISDDDVRHYADFLTERDDFRAMPMNCSLVSLNYREHLVEPMSADVRDSELRDYNFRQLHEDVPSVEIDTISYIFVNFFRFAHGYMQLCLDRLFYTPAFKRRESLKRPLDIRYLLARPVSIQVNNFSASTIAEAVETSDALIHKSLFMLAHTWGISAWTSGDWQPPRYQQQAERDGRRQIRDVNGADAILPHEKLNPAMLRLYQLGLSSPIASQQFMAFYQILEMAFQENITGLYDRLSDIINAGDFQTGPAGLQKLINAVETHQNYASADERLTDALNRYIGAGAITAWLTDNNSAQSIQSIETLSYRLRALRDAILCAGDGATFPAAEDTIRRELPLLQFLAEEMLLALAES